MTEAPALRTAHGRARAAVAALALAILAFAVGRFSAPGPRATWADGVADVVGEKVTIESGGWTYGFEGPVTWVDPARVAGDRDFPACLRGDGSHPVRFAWTGVDGPGVRVVAAVDCRG